MSRDDYQCQYCGQKATGEDHIFPRSKGGSEDLKNRVACCKDCNMAKSIMDLADFLNTSPRIDHRIVQRNRYIMAFVDFNGSQYVTRQVTGRHATEREEDKEEEREGEKEIKETPPADPALSVPYQKIVDLFNNSLNGSLPKVEILNDLRKKHIKARWTERPDLNFWEEFFERVRRSDFLCGRTEKDPWTGCSFDWLIKPSSFAKVIEGNYDNKGGSKPSGGNTPRGFLSLRNWENDDGKK
jgi:hypothetical protein